MDTIAVGLPGETEPVTDQRSRRDYQTGASWFRTALYAGAALVGLGLMAYAFVAAIAARLAHGDERRDAPRAKADPRRVHARDARTAAKTSNAATRRYERAGRAEGGKAGIGARARACRVCASIPTSARTGSGSGGCRQSAAPAPADPVQTATLLTPAPITPQQQLDVLGLVREMGVVVRDQRQEIAALRKTVADLGGRIGEFDQRLSLAEARGAVAAAMGAPVPAPERHTEPKTAESAPVVHHFRVQAASPGLAMLSVTDPGPDGAGPIQVQVGEQVPGYGKVKSIAQHGTTWRVVTERGPIE